MTDRGAERIVSLLPSATEILFAIGAGDRVVAITHECDYPAEAQHLPRVTANALPNEGQPSAVIDRHIRKARHDGSSIYLLDEARLAELQPALIVTQELCDVCAVNYAVVEQAVRRLPGDVPVISLEPTSLEDIVAIVLVLGRATGCERGAEQVAAAMRERFAVVQSLSAPSPLRSVACIEWTDPIMAGGHWVPQMVALAGGRDALGRAGLPSHDVTWDEVIAAAPEVMVLMPCGFGLERTMQASHDITARPGFDELPCARSGRVVAVDGSSYFNRPGPRIASGLEILAAAARSEPGDRLPAGAQWVPVPSHSPVATAG
jgi:iron complex transport system substrate-binding protein